MVKQRKKTRLASLIIISITILVAAIIWAVVRQQPAENIRTELNHLHERPLLTENPNDANEPKMTLDDIIKSADYWQPAYQSWYGKTAPDFTLTDITGKTHKLSDYRGKNVMIIFWATWCRPCRIEVPHLIALRNTIGEDKLAMLAVSYITTMPLETPEKVKKFVEKNPKINYPVFSSKIDKMPAPFNAISSIPCSFFIDAEGKIKLATEGLLTLGHMKAILQAESP